METRYPVRVQVRDPDGALRTLRAEVETGDPEWALELAEMQARSEIPEGWEIERVMVLAFASEGLPAAAAGG